MKVDVMKEVTNEAGEAMVAIVEPSTLEMKEFLASANHARRFSKDEAARDEMRHILRTHRFDVIIWLAQNGVAIPLELADESIHAQVGSQRPDQPIASADGGIVSESIDGIPPLHAEDL